jgi:mono/diheme cytochrome c family protein
MKSIMKAMFAASTVIAVAMMSGCGGSGSGSAPQSSTPGTASGTSSTGTSSAQLSAGAALYASNCAGCHGDITVSSVTTPTSLSNIQGAIAANSGGMGMFSAMTAANIQSIADAINNPTAATATPPTPPTTTVDGAALYATNCFGCHGALASSTKAGRTAAQIQAAINGSTGGMGFLSTLTPTQVSAIATALSPAPTTPAPPVTDGATLYATNCASCHLALASSTKAGRTASQIQTAINSNTGGMGFLSTLTPTQVSAIAAVLPPATSTTPPACGSCHAIPPATGHHAFHTSQRIACATCHGAGYSTTTVNAATHNNGVKNLTTTIGWNATSRSCSNSCHSTKTW